MLPPRSKAKLKVGPNNSGCQLVCQRVSLGPKTASKHRIIGTAEASIFNCTREPFATGNTITGVKRKYLGRNVLYS